MQCAVLQSRFCDKVISCLLIAHTELARRSLEASDYVYRFNFRPERRGTYLQLLIGIASNQLGYTVSVTSRFPEPRV